MKNYEAKKPSYFATPSPQLVHALNTALTQILASPLSERFAKHREVSDKIKSAVAALGLKQVASKPEDQAHTMTAIYLPETVKATDILPALAKKNIVFAGGLHKEIAPKYIRFGHMGVSVVRNYAFLSFSILQLTDHTAGSKEGRYRKGHQGAGRRAVGVWLPEGMKRFVKLLARLIRSKAVRSSRIQGIEHDRG